MASFSSSHVPLTGRWIYDVFVSWEDTSSNFVHHLYATLVQNGIRVYKDDKMIRRGSPISTKAIKGSRFAVVVFSGKYVKSSRCLDELAKIIECQDLRGQKVLPVFYHLDPPQILGDLTTAFQPHGLKFMEGMDKETKWRKALDAAGNLSCWHISPNKGRESLFINEIVQSILDHMQCDLMENNLVGIDSHIDALRSVLDLEATREVRLVAIWGMAGIGKTTIAQALFRRILHKFEGGSFVKDVGENYTRSICALLEKILMDMTHHTYMIKDPHHGMMILKKIFCYSKKLERIEAIGCSSAYGIRRYEDMCDMGFHADVFENIRNLRLLDISGSFTYCTPTTLPDKLRWLGWYDYPFSSLPLANLRNLVGLEMRYGEIEHFWTGDKVLPCLEYIDLSNSYYLKRLPDVSWAPNVERLILSGCSNMEEVHESLGSLKRLVYLDMRGCKNLKCLPSKIEMPLLETLDICDCSRLEIFPEVSSNMKKLSQIRVYGCSKKLENNVPDFIRQFCTAFHKDGDSSGINLTVRVLLSVLKNL